MSKNSRIKTKHSLSKNLGTYMPEFIEKGKTKKIENMKKQRKVKRERVKQINKNIMDFNKGGKR